MFVVGALPALVLVPLMWRYLPESAGVPARRGRPGRPRRPPGRKPAQQPGRHRCSTTASARSTIAFWITSFMGLLLVYGLNTWLPQIMRSAGYELGAALALLLVLNVGAVHRAAHRRPGRGPDRATAARPSAGSPARALFLALLSIRLPGIGVYVSVLLAGMFVFSAQVLVYAYVSHLYPAAARGTAMGAASGVGRLGAISGPLIGGVLLTAGLAYPWGFYIFAVVAAIGAVSHRAGQPRPGAGRADAGHRGRGRPHRRAALSAATLTMAGRSGTPPSTSSAGSG